MKQNKQSYAEMMTNEMGKPIKQAQGEIDKCINHVEYYQKMSLEFL